MFFWFMFGVVVVVFFVFDFCLFWWGFLGSEFVMELFVVVMKLLFVVFRKGVGRVCRICCEVGMVLVGGSDCEVLKMFICDGGIYGVSK